MDTLSLWIDTAPAPERPALTEDATADVCVVGAGITGLTTALLAAREGASVIVLEAGRVGGGVTGHTTGKVTSLHGLVYAELRSSVGEDGAAAYAEAQEGGLALVRDLVDELGIECDLRTRDAVTYAESARHRPEVEEEVQAARGAGLPADLVSDLALPFPVSGAVRVPGQAELHARRYVLGLADAIEAAGGRVLERTPVTGASWSGAPEVETKAGREVRAEHLVVTTHMPFLDRGLWWTRLMAKRSYAVAVRTAEWKPDAMYLSVDSPTRSVRGARLGDEEVVVVAGEGHATGEDDDTTRRYAALEDWARERLGATEVTHRWSSQDLQPADGLPYVGPYVPGADRTHVAAGFRKWGLTNGTAAAVVLADRIAGREHPWGDLLAADRAAPRQAKGILSEGWKDAKHFVGDRMRQGLGGSAEDLAPGEGGIVRGRAGPVAAYRDDDGTLHAVSPTCTHLGCRVRFNTAERTWDCPCHASRFSPDGTVLQGPATRPLGARDLA